MGLGNKESHTVKVFQNSFENKKGKDIYDLFRK